MKFKIKIFRIFIFICICHLLSSICHSQELNCSVQVVAPALQQSSDKQVLQTLQQTLNEFMNTKKWTSDVFSQDERIECSMVITVTSRPATDQFVATMEIQSRRPIYKSSYNSLLLDRKSVV